MAAFIRTYTFNYVVIPLLFHHLVCIGLPIPHSHFHQVLSRCKILQINTFKIRLYQTHTMPLQVIKFNKSRLHIRGIP